MAPLHQIEYGITKAASVVGGNHPISAGFGGTKSAAAALLLDAYPSAKFAFSFRKLRAAYAGSAVRIRRSSDSTEQDIGFSGNDFDSASAATFISGGTGYITTWYDQSGNGLDVTQTTAGNQPTYNATGLKSLPTWSAVNGVSNAYLTRAASAIGPATEGTFFAVLAQDSDSANNLFFNFGIASPASNMTIWAAFGDNNIYWDLGNSTGGSGRVNYAQPANWENASATLPNILECYRDSGDTQGITVNGSSLGSATATADLGSGTATINIVDISNPYLGFVSEVVWWTTDLTSSGRTGARSNINTYYGIF